MSTNTHILKEYFDPIKIREHQLGHTVTVGVSYHFTSLEKQGLSALLAKLPLADEAPVAMDIDLSCFVYDKAFNQPLQKAKKGMLYFGDKETPKAFSISFDQIEPDCQSLAAWQLSCYRGDWELSAPMVDIKLTKLSDKSLDTLTNAVTTHIQSAQSKRW